ncbi:MAG: mandelate racemase [Actinomycetota bacterium]|nr:mandelate racemase [Actinomycetota bacterium]
MTDLATVQSLSVATYVVPTEQPEADGTLSWDSTTVVLVEAVGGGCSGIGWTYSTRGCQAVIEDLLIPVVAGRPVDDVPRSWSAMVCAIRNLGRPGVASAAIAAVDLALWDLEAKCFDVPLCTLLGRLRDTVPVYGSGGFTTYDDATLRNQLDQWTGELGIERVKLKIAEAGGTRVARDLERVRQVRSVVGPEVEVYVDANGGYSRKQAVRVGRRLMDSNVCWFEEPVSSDDLAGLRVVRDTLDCDVTAGEYGSDLPYFRRMLDAGAVDCLQADVTRTAGVTEWLRVAAVAAAQGVEVSAHCAPTLHLHPAAAVQNLRHVEWFADHVRLEGLLFDPAPSVRAGVMRPDLSRPGLGVEVRRPDVDSYRVA